MEESSINFHGNGERAVPAAAPIPSDKKHLLSIFIDSSPLNGKKERTFVFHISPVFIRNDLTEAGFIFFPLSGATGRIICGRQNIHLFGLKRLTFFPSLSYGTLRSHSFSSGPMDFFSNPDCFPNFCPRYPGYTR
jgi:hypothetical protein